MKKSNYTIVARNHIKKGQFLVYNTRTQALLSVSREIVDAMECLPDESLFEGNDGVFDELTVNGILVKDDDADKEQLRHFFEQIENTPNAMEFNAIVLTTFNCNFSCAYCFEHNAKTRTRMDKQLCEDVIRWFVEEVRTHAYKSVSITFYGGEPLMNKDAITHIASSLHAWSKKEGVPFHFDMITNGYLLDPDDVDQWIPYGLRGVRITIDGDRESHDARRQLHSGEGTFDVIMKNLEAIIDKKINVSVTGNYDAGNLNGMLKLLDYFQEKEISEKLAHIGFSPILPRFGNVVTPGKVELTECMYAWDTRYHEMNMFLRREMLMRGLPVPASLGYLSCPLISRHNGVVIDPEGIVYKCPTMVGYPEYAVGTVHKPGYNEKLEEFVSIHAWEKCDDDCPYIPACSGGCRFMAFARDGHFKDIWCDRENITAVAEELIQLDYEKCVKRVTMK